MFNATAGVDKHTVQETDRGSKMVLEVEIFKAAQFKDSMGELRTWTLEQLAAMAANFALLRDADIFPNVPLRKDHGWSVEDIIGYIASVKVVGDKLVADLEFTDDDGFAKFDNGTFRSRSLEVGMYEDNNGVTWWPVIFGLAFVDIPAVEGLHSGRRDQDKAHIYEETTVPDQPTQHQLHTFKIGDVETTDYARVQAHIAQVQTERDEAVAKHSAAEGENAALKAQVETLTTAQAEQVAVARANFVSGLATAKKITATQVESLTELAKTMTDAQFEAFSKSYEAAPVLSLFGNHGSGVTNPAGGEPDERATKIAELEERVAMHRRAGISEDDVKNTPSFKELAALTAASSN